MFVYVGQTLIKTYYVPAQGVGNLWAVFAVTEAGEFQDINLIKGVTSHDRLDAAEFQGVMSQTQIVAPVYASGSLDDAKSLNKQGEIAYHAGNLDEAIRLYQEAIELNGNYGQAYSNLGLAFQKANRVAEAMWANRKAIALADGPSAKIVRASSHFNNGKIYEAAAQWDDALREYTFAINENNNPSYTKAIERMKQKGAK